MRVFTLFALMAALIAQSAPAAEPVPIDNRGLAEIATILKPDEYVWNYGLMAGQGVLRLVIDVQQQKIFAYRGAALVGAASVSTGAAGHDTPRGRFPILQKAKHHRSNIYSNAPMPFMQRLTWRGIALHAGHNPGHPASHGCIRLPLGFARDLFAITKMGTMVEVVDGHAVPMQAEPKLPYVWF
jgi:hypothetical protein